MGRAKRIRIGIELCMLVVAVIGLRSWRQRAARDESNATALEGSGPALSATGDSAKQAATTGDRSPAIVTQGGVVHVYNGPTTFSGPLPPTNTPVAIQTNGADDIVIWAANPETGELEKVDPVEGQLYTRTLPNGNRLQYMLKDGFYYTDFVSVDGAANWHRVLDKKGDLVRDSDLERALWDYTVVIPKALEIRREETKLPNGRRRVHVYMKWGESAEMEYDPSGKMLTFRNKGAVRINRRARTITFTGPPTAIKRGAPDEYQQF